ncbi:MAG TPA: ubiquinol oxidase subunit II [Rhodanobacteraceae bacterium]
MSAKRLIGLLLAPAVLLLGGCQKLVLLHPQGFVAKQQSDIMITSTIIIAIIIVPVLIAIAVVAWKYRASNKKAKYTPEWDHSSQLELLVWAGPLLIIIAVGAISWIGTHKTDPYAKIDRADAGTAINAADKPLEVDVVSMRWKWLFFYPQYGIATVNELAAPVNRPINFKITSSDMMDAFFVPTLAGMIYTMPGMQTQLHAVINKPGKYKGMSANFSGAGFTHMQFWFYGKTKQGFEQWVAKVRAKGTDLSTSAYLQLHKPSIAVPVTYYTKFSPGLYSRILNRCVIPGQVCLSQQMAYDRRTDEGKLWQKGKDKVKAMNMSMPMPAVTSKPASASTAAAH